LKWPIGIDTFNGLSVEQTIAYMDAFIMGFVQQQRNNIPGLFQLFSRTIFIVIPRRVAPKKGYLAELR